jgi:CRP/FNR family transcriptional regulator, cyclic AMP receptor protein
MDYTSEVVGQVGSTVRGDRSAAETRERVLNALRKCDAFAGCERVQLADVAEASSYLRTGRRRRIYAQGEPISGLYVVAVGRVRVVRGANEARALTVAYRGVGEIIGEIAITDRVAHEDSASATDPVELVQIPLRQLRELLVRNGDVSRRLLQLMVERRLETERSIESLLSRSVESRVAEFLIDAAKRHGIPDSRGLLISVKYTHQEIADYVGSTRETVTLTLGDLRRRNLVSFDHRRIVVCDAEALVRVVEHRA